MFIHRIILAGMLLGISYMAQAQNADAIYFNGNIITINDAQPNAQAVAIREGKIIAVGDKASVFQHQDAKTQLIDLKGKALLPGFVDAHGHVSMTGLQAISANLLPAPDGQGNSIAALQKILKAYAKGEVAQKHHLIIGFGYDEAQLKEKRPPTRQELDAVSKDIPVIIIHQSGHLGVLNSKALAIAGVNAQSKDPEGGVIRREQDGKTPNGTLEETAWFAAGMKLVIPGPQEFVQMLLAGQKLYAQFGFTTGQDGRSDEGTNQTWIGLANANKMLIDVVSYPDITHAFCADLMKTEWVRKDYKNHFRVGGVKLSLDGSPQGKTAYLTKPYLVPPHGQDASYRGYPAMSDEQAAGYIDQAYQNNWQLLVHTNGDAASDQMLKGVQQAVKKWGLNDRRTVMIHAQTVREDQLDLMKELAVVPSFFGMHTYYWGDWHRDETLGAVRADRISPAVSALRRGMIFTEHHDAPVAFPDAMAILDAVVNRRTRSSDILGPDQRLDMATALKSITLWAAWQHFEEASKGSIEVGKNADFVILSANPMTIEPSKIRSVQVLETIKAGNRIYKKASI